MVIVLDDTIIIKAEDISFFYQEDGGESPPAPAIDGLSLEIKKGTFTAILGRNGSGKSTLARQFNGILLPTGGRVLVYGMDTKDEKISLEIRRRIGLVFQNPDNQIVSNVVEEDVAFAPENLGFPPEEIRKVVDEVLSLVGMYEYREHAPHLLSGGQKQRIAIAGVLAMKPECVVFDEPTAMLDPKGREDVIQIIRDLGEFYNTTVVLITHHMEETVSADRLIVMDRGKIALDGPPAEIFTQVDRLMELGLAPPKTTELMWELNRRGFDLPLGALSERECAEEIFKALTNDR
ncbi:MAG: energy-coupling factor transporter ATPase [Oscillospiraceae bacterium]|nr:energy-coupling factor transporter ATPase [Oscillospiraceae bacterium]